MDPDWTSRLSNGRSRPHLLVDFRNLNLNSADTQPGVDSKRLLHYCDAVERLMAQGIAADQAAATMFQCGGDTDAAELWAGSCFAAGLSCIPGGTAGAAGNDATETWVWEAPTGQLHLASNVKEIQAMMQQSAWAEGTGMLQVIDSILCGVTEEMQQDVLLLEKARQQKLKAVGSLTAPEILQRLSAASGIQSSRVIAIEEVINPTLWRNYSKCKAGMPLPNEKWLFHGSCGDNVARIVAEGFDLQLANINGSYGAGVYFALHSATSHQYTARAAVKPDTPWSTIHQCSSPLLKAASLNKHHVLLLCSVLLGVEGTASAKLTKAPAGTSSVAPWRCQRSV